MNKKKKITANEFTNVRDIRDIFLYTKNGYILCYLHVYPYNIDLLSTEERKAKTTMLSRSFDSDRKDFAYFSFPREIDLEVYKKDIKTKFDQCLNDFGRKHILNEMVLQAAELETNGENYEHQHYIKLWKLLGSDAKDAERDLRMRINEFADRYRMVGIRTEILQAAEIIKMCNLFGNGQQAPYDVPMDAFYESLLLL